MGCFHGGPVDMLCGAHMNDCDTMIMVSLIKFPHYGRVQFYSNHMGGSQHGFIKNDQICMVLDEWEIPPILGTPND